MHHADAHLGDPRGDLRTLIQPCLRPLSSTSYDEEHVLHVLHDRLDPDYVATPQTYIYLLGVPASTPYSSRSTPSSATQLSLRYYIPVACNYRLDPSSLKL